CNADISKFVIIDNEDIAIDANTGDTGTDEEPVDTATSNSLQPQVPPPPKKEKVDPKLAILKDAFGILKTSASKSNDDNDEIITFFKFAANKMRKYETHTKNAVQQAICDILFKADYGYYSQSQYGYYTSPSSSTSTNVPSTPFVCQQNTTPTRRKTVRVVLHFLLILEAACLHRPFVACRLETGARYVSAPTGASAPVGALTLQYSNAQLQHNISMLQPKCVHCTRSRSTQCSQTTANLSGYPA
ncbi:unnamed protein product, partial [Leptidea sinapis]